VTVVSQATEPADEVADGNAERREPRLPWLAIEDQVLRNLHGLGIPLSKIAAALGRSVPAVNYRLARLRAQTAIRERQARDADLESRRPQRPASTTALLMGDPAPGRSALDRTKS
jgi:hypothetical protein